MGNCFGVQEVNPLVLQMQLSEKEKEIKRMKVAQMAQDKRVLQDAQEMQEVSKLRELLLLNALKDQGQERSSLKTKNHQLSHLNRQLAENLKKEKTLNTSLKQL